MADASKIHIGPGDVWVTSDLTAVPTSGADKTDPTSSGLASMASGFTAPSMTANPSWRNVGFTNGPATLTYRPTYYSVESEQAFAEIVTTPTAEEASLGFTMLEADYRNLAITMGQGTTHVVTGPPVQNAIHSARASGQAPATSSRRSIRATATRAPTSTSSAVLKRDRR
jgi:hypothetical protein